MGKEVRGKLEAPALTGDPERSIGAYLARQRELRGISLDELAALTRIPRRSLERLESGVFDRAPDGFVRGFVRTVAVALGLDPDAAVMRLLSEPAVEADAGPRVARRTGLTARWVAFACAGLLVVAALAWLVASRFVRSDAPRPSDAVMRRDPIRELARELERGAREMGEAAAPARDGVLEAGAASDSPTREPAALGAATGASAPAPLVGPETPPAALAPVP
jgi:transcriptional regulator with XRE-family HTH domain